MLHEKGVDINFDEIDDLLFINKNGELMSDVWNSQPISLLDSNINNFSLNLIWNSTYGGIEIYSSYNNTFYSSNIAGNNWSGVYFENSSENYFYDSVLIGNNLVGTKGDVAFLGTGGGLENFINVRDPITSVPVINNGKLFIYTENSRILGFN